MLKTSSLQLPGRDAGSPITLTELPALVADRFARTALAAIGAPLQGGVVSLALEHVSQVMRHPNGAALLQPFVQTDRPVEGWRNVLPVQQAALALHAGFMVGRPQLEIPVAMKSDVILQSGSRDLAVNWCSPHIATVIHSGYASYRELETVLSTEDVFNLVELANLQAVREWHAYQQTRT